MALTLAVVRQGVDSYGDRFVEADVTFDDSYPTNGEAPSLTELGLNRVERIEITQRVMPDATASTRTNHGQQVVGVVTNVYAPKLKVFTSADTEAANTSDQSGVTERIRFIGA